MSQLVSLLSVLPGFELKNLISFSKATGSIPLLRIRRDSKDIGAGLTFTRLNDKVTNST